MIARFFRAAPAWLAQAVSMGALVACADARPPEEPSGSGGAPNQCTLPACPGMDPTGEGSAASFRQDVLPTIQRNCTDFLCHGNEIAAAAGLYLGRPPPAVVDASVLVASLVGMRSRTAPALDLVTAGSPSTSFLLLKVEGCQNALGLSCKPQLGSHSGEPCGDVMPQGARPICTNERRLMSSWIAAGAHDD
jgi:hypothetical protein